MIACLPGHSESRVCKTHGDVCPVIGTTSVSPQLADVTGWSGLCPDCGRGLPWFCCRPLLESPGTGVEVANVVGLGALPEVPWR